MDGQEQLPGNFPISGVCVNGAACDQSPFTFGASYMTCCSNLNVESFSSDQDAANNIVADCYSCAGT